MQPKSGGKSCAKVIRAFSGDRLMGSNFDWDAFFSGRKAKKNPRRSLTSVTRTPSALSQRGIAPSTERNIFEAGPSLQQMQVYPSGDPIRSISQAQPLEPVYQQVYTPPTRHTGGQGGSLPRGVGYSRSYSASQGAAQPSTGMKDLIDPQLWRLADGGSYPAMVELERRGPGHYRPARPNPGTWPAQIEGGELTSSPRGKEAIYRSTQLPNFVALISSQKKRGPWGVIYYSDGEATSGCDSLPSIQAALSDVVAEFKFEVEATFSNTKPNPRNPTLAHLVDGGRGLRGKDLSNMPRGLRRGVKKGILHHDQHEPLWPAPRVSKARPGYGGFLKGKTGWPAWKEDSGWNHAKVVIQFMIMGRGNPSDYPSLIRKMAKILPPNEPALSGIWAKYQRNFAKIQKKSGGRMPTLTQLKKIEGKANPRRRRNTAGFVQQPQIIDVSSARPLFRWGWEEADGKMHGGYTFSDEAALQDLAKDVAQAFGIPVKDIGTIVYRRGIPRRGGLGADGDFWSVVVFSEKTDQDLVEGQLVHFGGLEQSGLASMLSDPPVAHANPYARKNFFWGGKKAAPVISYREALARAEEMSAQYPRKEDQYYLVKMPKGSKTVWYFLPYIRDRAFEGASKWGAPVSYIDKSNPWRTVWSNLQTHRQPGKYSVVVLDTLTGESEGPLSCAQVKARAGAKSNPRTRGSRRRRK